MKKLLALAALVFAISICPALAYTCAHVETGQALDPQDCDTIGHYLQRYTAEVTRGWTVVIVPAGTQHNAAATQNGDGSWSTINPAVQASMEGRDLTEAEFAKLGMAINMTGINNALKDLPVFAILLRQYTNLRGLNYHDAITADGNALNTAIATLVAGGYYSTAQRDAFLALWRSTYPPGS